MITERSTKAEIFAAYESAVKRHDAFKRKVVRVALKSAANHGWCTVIWDILQEDLKLGAFMPTHYWIEAKESGQIKWEKTDFYEGKHDAEGEYEHCVDAQRWRLGSDRFEFRLVKVTKGKETVLKEMDNDRAKKAG